MFYLHTTTTPSIAFPSFIASYLFGFFAVSLKNSFALRTKTKSNFIDYSLFFSPLPFVVLILTMLDLEPSKIIADAFVGFATAISGATMVGDININKQILHKS